MDKYRQEITVYGRKFPVTVEPKPNGYYVTLHWHNRIELSAYNEDVLECFKELEHTMRARLSNLARSCEEIKKTVNQKKRG